MSNFQGNKIWWEAAGEYVKIREILGSVPPELKNRVIGHLPSEADDFVFFDYDDKGQVVFYTLAQDPQLNGALLSRVKQIIKEVTKEA